MNLVKRENSSGFESCELRKIHEKNAILQMSLKDKFTVILVKISIEQIRIKQNSKMRRK